MQINLHSLCLLGSGLAISRALCAYRNSETGFEPALLIPLPFLLREASSPPGKGALRCGTSAGLSGVLGPQQRGVRGAISFGCR